MHPATALTRADIARDPKSINHRSSLVSYITAADGLAFLTYFLAKLEANCTCGAFQDQLPQAEIVTAEELKLDELQGLDLDLRELAKQARRAARSDSDSSSSDQDLSSNSDDEDSTTIVAPGDEQTDTDTSGSDSDSQAEPNSDFELDPDSYEAPPNPEFDLFGL